MIITNKTVCAIAEELGFNSVGFARSGKLVKETGALKEWVANKYNAGMAYMADTIDKRENPELVFEGVKSVISLSSNYYIDEDFSDDTRKGKISRYAWGRDYHFILWEKLNILIERLKEIDRNFDAKSFVDSGPVMDKAWAIKAGLGWMGKHSNIISKSFGSWFFISTVLTNYEFEYNEPMEDLCGNCTACITACPTEAIIKPFVVDANKCISYQTIENKGEISPDLKGEFSNYIFGCDLCQDVCPWNIKFARQTADKEFIPEIKNKELSHDEIKNMTEEDFRKRFKESPIKRAKLKGLKRNADFVLE